MRRRQVLTLASTSALAMTAGCFGTSGGGGGGGAAAGQGAAPPVKEAVEFIDHRLKRTDEGSISEQVSVTGTAKNTSDAKLEDVQIRATFYDENDEELQTNTTNPRDIPGGREWSFEVNFNGSGSEARAVKDYDVEAGTGFDE